MAVVLDVLASYVQNMLIEMAKEEVHKLLGVSGEIDKMCTKLGDLKNSLADADRRNITDSSVQAWVRELKGAMYEATDILDLCQLKSMERQPGMDTGCFNPLLFCMRNPLHAHDISSRIKNLNKRLDGIKNRGAAFDFINLVSYEDRNRMVASFHPSKRETSGELDGSGVVGEKIEEDTKSLVRMMTQGTETSYGDKNILIFAIVGVGGIGKTTLAQKIFNNKIVQEEFSKKIWLSVNQELSAIELLQRAITEAGGDHQAASNTKGALERTLKEALNGHKTLLVMDDVWNHEAWEGVLKTPLINTLARGSRVLVTTRDIRVARGMMAEEPYHHVKKLEPEVAWSLLKNQVVGNENNEPQIDMLKDIGMGIIEKCDGLPLAVKVMGGLLRQRRARRGDWENVLNDSIWSVSQMPEELNYAIYLSYQDLHPSLKSCFLHYSLLPKSTWFYLDEIVGMWISEGFVHGNWHDLEELGRQYYEELILRNLIELDKKYIDQQVCNMHDVVRSFAQYVARNEALVAHRIESGIFDKLNSQKFIWLSVETTGSESNDLEWSSLQAQISVRTMISVGHIKFKPSDLLLSFSRLRILHIQSAEFDTLAESFFRFKHLRYLSIKHTNISRLPESIGKMKLLQHISLFGCKCLVTLPGSIGKLQQLRLLNLSATSITHIPRGLGVLTNLRKLYGFPAQMDGDWCSLEELGPLSQLIDLHIRGLENVPSSSFASKAKLSEKVRLSYLRLSCTSGHGHDDGLVKDKERIFEEQQRVIEEVFDELCPPSCLVNLAILRYFGRRLPAWMTSTAVVPFGNLRILTMIDLPCCTELPDGLCKLPCLEFLQIDRAPSVKHVGPKFLKPYHPENLGSVVEFEVLESPELERICNLPKLQRLCISMCPKIKELDGLSALEMLKLEDYDMNTLPGYLQDINLRHLQIYCDISLLTSIANGKSSPEWDKFQHIQQVNAYADDGKDIVPRKWAWRGGAGKCVAKSKEAPAAHPLPSSLPQWTRKVKLGSTRIELSS
ncbi:putative disease resistance protein RGA3 isoform X2 [Setaria viridis]|uniref:putative disease resistance protein RGA3 isoform X2 n=1 Tax=Setaria viridis TaxID=4556 RepID=UPI003B3BD59D